MQTKKNLARQKKQIPYTRESQIQVKKMTLLLKYPKKDNVEKAKISGGDKYFYQV